MTRRSLLVLVTILVSVFTFVPIRLVGACELDANDRCVQMDPAEQAAMFRSASAPMPSENADSDPAVHQRIVMNTHQLAVVPVCTGLDDSGYVPTCYTPQPDGSWLVTQKDWEGIWQQVGTVTTLPPPPMGPSHP